MKALLSSFKYFCTQIAKDNMLLLVCLTPLLEGILFKYGIPVAESKLTEYFAQPAILSPYYLMFDLFFICTTPILFCFASAMVMLGEIDDKISSYLAVTPIGKSGYIISRLAFPILLSTIATCLLLPIFALTSIHPLVAVSVAVLSGFIGAIEAMLIITLSSNKVEGMAIAKLTGFIMLGIPIPFFIPSISQYIASFLPSFWVAKFAMSPNPFYILAGLVIVALWGIVLYKKFVRKIV